MRIQLPDHGVFLHWPQPGVGWVHPDDVLIAGELIPSSRVFRRHRFDGTYYHLTYGRRQLRLRPVMWLTLEDEGFEVGQWVEVSSIGLARESFVGQILEARYDRRTRQIRYTVRRADMRQPRKYRAAELKSLVDRELLAESDFQIHRLPIESETSSPEHRNREED